MVNPILQNILQGFVEIFKSPFKDLSILWVLTPILLFWILLEIYFDRYQTEELGWNTALGNGLSVFWVTLTCMRYLFETQRTNFQWIKFLAIILILLYAIFIILNSFWHKLKKNWSFIISSPTPIYFLSLVVVLWTYGQLIITKWIILDLIILYIIIGFIELGIKKLIKPKEEPSKGFLEKFSQEK